MNSQIETEMFKILHSMWMKDDSYIQDGYHMNEDFKENPFKIYTAYDKLQRMRDYLCLSRYYIDKVIKCRRVLREYNLEKKDLNVMKKGKVRYDREYENPINTNVYDNPDEVKQESDYGELKF